MKTACIIGVICLATVWASAGTDTGRTWKDSWQQLLQVSELQDERREVPENKWIGRDQTAVDQEIEELLDNILEVLKGSPLTDQRAEYAELGEKIAALRGEIRDLREESLSAPKEASKLAFYKKTQATYKKRIASREKRIKELQEAQAALVNSLTEEAGKMGLKLTRKQVAFYLKAISGEDIMALTSVFYNVRELNAQLEELVRQSPEDPEAARRYYGIHVALIQAVLLAHERTVEAIDKRYLPRLDELEAENARLQLETGELMKSATSDQQHLLEATQRTQHVTEEALKLYREHLLEVRKGVAARLAALQSRHAVALNAYHTIRISALLASEMQAAVKDLNALRDMRLPALIPLESEALQQKFAEITRDLQAQ